MLPDISEYLFKKRFAPFHIFRRQAVKLPYKTFCMGLQCHIFFIIGPKISFFHFFLFCHFFPPFISNVFVTVHIQCRLVNCTIMKLQRWTWYGCLKDRLKTPVLSEVLSGLVPLRLAASETVVVKRFCNTCG